MRLAWQAPITRCFGTLRRLSFSSGPAIYRDDCAAGYAIGRRGEKSNDFREIGGGHPTPIVCVRHRRSVCRSVEDRGGYSIDPDLFVGGFLRQRLSQRRDGGFGGCVGHHPGPEPRLERRPGCHIDDPPAFRTAWTWYLAHAKCCDRSCRAQKARKRIHTELTNKV